MHDEMVDFPKFGHNFCDGYKSLEGTCIQWESIEPTKNV